MTACDVAESADPFASVVGLRRGGRAGAPDTVEVANADGKRFAFRVVRRGDHYGRGRELVHAEAEAIVEAYDADYAGRPGFEAEGQITGSYYLSTLFGHRGPLNLHGGIPEWTVDAQAMDVVRAWMDAL